MEGGKGLTAKSLRVCPDLLDKFLNPWEGIFEADGQIMSEQDERVCATTRATHWGPKSRGWSALAR